MSALENNLTLGAEYYSKIYIEAFFKVKACKNTSNLLNIAKRITDGDHGVAEYQPQGVLYLLSENIKSGYIDTTNAKYIDIQKNNFLKRSELHPGDVVVTKTGVYFGKSAVIPESIKKANMIAHVGKIELNETHNPYFVSTFLNCIYGYYQMRRRGIKATRPEIKLIEFADIVIPKFSDEFDKKIERAVLEGNNKIEQSIAAYNNAEKILLTALGLENFTPSDKNISVQSFASSFKTTGRLDAEYYQPKYEELENKLSVFPQIKIGDLVCYPVCSGSTPKAGSANYYSDEKNGVPFIRAVDIEQSRVNTENFIHVTPTVHKKLLKRTQLKKNDVLFSIAGTVGRCGIFDYDFAANINQAVSILRFSESKLKRLYLIQFFNSSIGKILVEKYSRQGLQTNLNLDEVSNLSVPIIDYATQTKIAAQVQNAFALREKSKALLKAATNAVEAAIEHSEAAGLKMIGEFV